MIKYLMIIILICTTCHAEDFYKTHEWINLLYYEKIGTTYKSIADSDEFFLTKSGKTDPKAEYDAALKLTQAQDPHFRKTFPLRYKRITEATHLPYLPLVTPNADVTSVSIVFPNRYMANPASMFGHLFLILNSKQGLMDSDILHYIADSKGSNKFAYLYNGLMGNFKGWFLQEPYYRKIKHYNYLEDREITYYDLSLPQNRIEDLQLHAIELQKTHFNYYFFDENCAFFTGKLLNVVLEDDLIAHDMMISPSDIINRLQAKSLLTKRYDRESSVKLFNTHFNKLSKTQKSQVTDLIFVKTDKVPTDSEILTGFISISEYLINNHSPLADTIRHNRIKAYQELSLQGKAKVRQVNVEQPLVNPIQSKDLSIGYGFSDRIFLAYDPICYGEYSPFGSLEVKGLNVLAPRIIIGGNEHPQFDLKLAEISNISPYNIVVNSNSWKLNTSIGYKDSLLTNNSFEMGHAYYFHSKTRLIGLIGATISNYNTISEDKLSSVIIRPSINFGIETQVLKDQFNTSLNYDYKFEKSYLTAKASFKMRNLVHQITYTRGTDFEGVKLSVVHIF